MPVILNKLVSKEETYNPFVMGLTTPYDKLPLAVILKFEDSQTQTSS